MQAFEFSTVLENGYIHVPEIYSGQIKSPVQVIILAEEAPPAPPKKRFSPPCADTRGYTFNRKEVYER
jgi:hypothetical protein